MCGIFGFSNCLFPPSQRIEMITQMNKMTAHRGPNEFKWFTNEKVTIGSNRLSITDIQNGSQPFKDSSGKVICFFNGEIYNFKKLKKDLMSKGYFFYSDCDGEVIPALYLEYGYDFLSYLDGMFAICLYDETLNELVLAVDPYSIKQLYYTTQKETFVFCSEIKGLSVLPHVKFDVSEEKILQYLFYKAVFPPETAFNEIKKLTPSSFLIIKNGRLLKKQKYTPKQILPSTSVNLSLGEMTQQFKESLINAVLEMVPKEVHFSCLLSGGLDSSTICSILKKYTGDPFDVYSIGYSDDLLDDERKFARRLSKNLNLHLHEVLLTPEEIPILLEKVSWSLEEPIQDPITLPTYKVIEQASESNRVLLTGDGADELFGGYNRYKALLKKGKAAYLDELGTLSLDHFTSMLELSNFSDPYFGTLPLEVTLEDVMKLEQITRLPSYHLVRVDKLSMAHSVEARVPLLRNVVREYSELMNTQYGCIQHDNEKWLLKKSLADIVPSYIINRKKKPFTLPISHWVKDELYDFIHSSLFAVNSQSTNYFSKKQLTHLLNVHKTGKYDYSSIIWALINLEYFYQNVQKLKSQEVPYNSF
ncbi:asparagine synthase (glutamine-hydrolyzing) [Bacillus gobiensis]|uniref:asparagine synthase (glutamine-hydrolyzing) n=1 Tax=Bacillus gobiensis TaxID=1441095 RepID=UPI003D1FED26